MLGVPWIPQPPDDDPLAIHQVRAKIEIEETHQRQISTTPFGVEATPSHPPRGGPTVPTSDLTSLFS